ncbi:MAG: response regulator [Planctomycetota bacterium]
MIDNAAHTVLVVDDHPATLYSTTRVLRAAGFQVVEAATGTSALHQANADVDIVVLDVNLPDISGFEVCRRLRADPQTARLPIVHLSATFVKDDDKVLGFTSGADGYLTHPIEPPVLIATVRAFLRTRLAEAETRASEAKFHAVFDAAPTGIALVCADLTYHEVNPAWAMLLGRPSEELKGCSVLNLWSDPEQAQVVASCLANEGAWRGTLPLQDASGKTLHLEWYFAKRVLPGLHLALVVDISERVQSEVDRRDLLASERAARAEAERANRLKDEFLATLSHDLRTPLSAIVTWCELLQHPSTTPTQLAQGLQAIDRNARVQTQLIADLLDVSRIGAGKLRLNLQTIEPGAFVSAALDAILPTAQAKDVQVHVDLRPVAGHLSGDATRLQQVVWNLVSNAVKFTPGGGRIDISLDGVPHEMELRVRDSGRGIAAKFLPYVFDRFRQGAPGTSTEDRLAQGMGLGLGLSIVRHIVEMHGGEVRVESPGENQGATFFVKLPLVPVSASEVTHDTPRPVDLGDARILVVDDDGDARALLERVLRESGADVRGVESVTKALEVLETFAPRLLISDIGMPERDGYALIREVRASGHDSSSLPAIAITAYAGEEERQRILRAGFQLRIPKPIIAAHLPAAIAKLLRRGDEGSADDTNEAACSSSP